jgi:hypothetical protein
MSCPKGAGQRCASCLENVVLFVLPMTACRRTLRRKVCLIFLVVFMVFNIPFNNISVISWQSVLLVEETGVPGENHRSAASH